MGTDAAFGLSLAQVIIEEGLHDQRFIVEQTDLPLLVRKDTRRFLRQQDLEEGGRFPTTWRHAFCSRPVGTCCAERAGTIG